MTLRSFIGTDDRFLTVLAILVLYFTCLYFIEKGSHSRVKDCLLLFLQELI